MREGGEETVVDTQRSRFDRTDTETRYGGRGARTRSSVCVVAGLRSEGGGERARRDGGGGRDGERGSRCARE